MIKKNFAILFVAGILFFQNLNAAAAEDAFTPHQRALPSTVPTLTDEGMFEFYNKLGLCKDFITYKNDLAKFKRAIKDLDFNKKTALKLNLALISENIARITMCLMETVIPLLPRSGCSPQEWSYALEKIHPYVSYAQTNSFNPLMKKLKKLGLLPHEEFGLVSLEGFDEMAALIYIREKEDNYLVKAVEYKKPYLETSWWPFGATNADFQSVCLIEDDHLITNPGFLVLAEKASPRKLKIKEYYGDTIPGSPLKISVISLEIPLSQKFIYEYLFQEMSAELIKISSYKERHGGSPDTGALFIPVPQTRKEENFLKLLLITDLMNEEDPVAQERTLSTLEYYGFFEPEVIESAKRVLEIESGASSAPSSSLPGPTPPVEEPKSYRQKMQDLQEQAYHEAQQIKEEQEAVRARVIAGSSSEHPAKPKKSKSKKPAAAAAAAAETLQNALEDDLADKVRAFMKTHSLQHFEKFRRIRTILGLFVKEGATVRTRGSHETFETPSGRSVTIAHHGMNDVVPVARIIKDFLRSLGGKE